MGDRALLRHFMPEEIFTCYGLKLLQNTQNNDFIENAKLGSALGLRRLLMIWVH